MSVRVGGYEKHKRVSVEGNGIRKTILRFGKSYESLS